ncbi:MAG: FAD-binding and (Fe-S)-binding domain-containing protein [Actinomycetota bacterium]
MGVIQGDRREHLEKIFGDRVNFARLERKLYSHDIAEIPGLIRPLIGNTIPDAIVQPANEKEVVELVKWARQHNIPLTPRGRATSGYGGAVPIRNGLVVDFYRMRALKSVDKKNLTVTVEPGMVWETLDKKLAPQGLTLRLYPTSYPSSSVAGWLAQGGAGIGSYESGWFRDNVVHARVVLPDGSIRIFSGPDLDLISDAEGTTGLITEVMVKVMPLEEQTVMAVAIKEPKDLQAFLEDLITSKLKIWSTLFINPKMAALKNKSPLMVHWDHAAEQRIELPEAYIVIITSRERDEASVRKGVEGLVKKHEGKFLPQEMADHEWANRFKTMTVKRLGPSLVPAEVIVPLDNLAFGIDEIARFVDQPLVKEGVVVKEGKSGRPEVVLLGFIPADQRKFKYNFVFALSLSIMKVAKKAGGRGYATGLFFAREAPSILGENRYQNLIEFKQEVDPTGFMNPGKVTGTGLINTTMGLAFAMEPIVRKLGNAASTEIGERPSKPVRDIPADVAWYAYACSQCGYCVEECDQFYGRGWESQSPRGKWYWLREYMEGREEWSNDVVRTFTVCTTCEMCDFRCSESLPIEPSWMKLRGIMINDEKRLTLPPFYMMGEATSAEGDIWAGYRKNRWDWFPKDLEEKHGPGKKSKNVYFAGCTASYVEHDIAQASVRLLDEAGVDFSTIGVNENCCGTPMLVAGKWDIFKNTIEENIANVKALGGDTVIASCPACDMMWRHVYPVWAGKFGIDYDIKVKHYSEILAEQIRNEEFKFPEKEGKEVTVTWHDSCHMGRATGVYDEPRELIKAVPNTKLVEMEYNREKAHCCASVLTLIADPPIAAEIGKDRLQEAIDAGAEKVLALCPCCEFQLRVAADKKDMHIEVQDLARFAAASLGYDFPDPHPEVKAQWAVFEAMINLMTPQGFADLMGTMWPELIDAMPFKMGPMMRAMGKIPGALTLMKPVFPILFPRLLPMMLPKVMPTMLDRVADKIPMPDYMKEQMPALMPPVMDDLMPHMINDVVPLVTQPMIDYLHGK